MLWKDICKKDYEIRKRGWFKWMFEIDEMDVFFNLLILKVLEEFKYEKIEIIDIRRDWMFVISFIFFVFLWGMIRSILIIILSKI